MGRSPDRWRLLLTIMATKQNSNIKPLPLGDTLRDLALLRVSSLDLASLIPASTKDEPPTTEADASVERSQGFIQSARSALKTHDVGTVDAVGQKLESLRTGLDEVSQGLETT